MLNEISEDLPPFANCPSRQWYDKPYGGCGSDSGRNYGTCPQKAAWSISRVRPWIETYTREERMGSAYLGEALHERVHLLGNLEAGV